MRLSIKLLGMFVAVMLCIISLDGVILFKREVTFLENDLRDRMSIHAHHLAIMSGEVWYHAGEARAAYVLDSLNLQQSLYKARVVKLEVAEGHDRAPQVRIGRLGDLFRGKYFTLFQDEANRQHLLAYAPIIVNEIQVGAVEVSQPTEIIRRYSRGTAIHVVILSLALVIAGFGLIAPASVFLVTRPVQMLIAKTREIGRQELQNPLKLRRHDEFTELAEALNTMCDNLHEARRRAALETERRITALQHLRHAERLATLGQISSGIAHELGTPLNIISGRAKILINETDNADEIIKGAHFIISQVDRIAEKIREFLDFARRPQMQNQPVDIVNVVRRTIRLLDPVLKNAHVDITFSSEFPAFEFSGDCNQLQQVFSNIIMNAVQAMRQDVAISISCCKDMRADENGRVRPCLVVNFADSGQGVPLGDREKIFEPFYTTKEVGKGTGLGLSIARDIVRDHGGDITVGDASGHGAVFSVILPTGEHA